MAIVPSGAFGFMHWLDYRGGNDGTIRNEERSYYEVSISQWASGEGAARSTPRLRFSR